jgi:lactoylglutathione lyase
MKTKLFLIMSGLALLLVGCAGNTKVPVGNLPAVDHILLEISDMNTSITFYRDLLGLSVKSNDGHFAMLQAENMRVALWDKRWDWEAPKTKDQPPGLGMYPHLKVLDVKETVKHARKAGYKIIQEPRSYYWGTEGFIADPDGYIWALVN